MNLNLKDKVTIVTGGGSGLGAAICTVMAQEGANVVVNYIDNEEKVFEFSQNLSKTYGVKSLGIYGDVSNPDDVDLLIKRTLDYFGQIDILVNNAGIWPTHYVMEMPDEEWDKTIRVNLTGPFLTSKRFVNYLVGNNRKGKIINIVSQAAFHGSTTGHAHYAAAKGGLVTFTRSLAREVAKYGINVVAVAPGMMRTPMNEEALRQRENQYLERIPLGRIADPIEVAYTVVFLASDKADYITGATVDVSGGMLMR